MDKATENKKKEKPTPNRCVCGCAAVLVKAKGKKMVSCPNPERCKRNLRTRWHGHEVSAITEWNTLVESCGRVGGESHG